MTKKEFEKESYLAPQWGMRTIRVERHFLDNSPWNEGGGGSYGDDDSNDNGEY